MILPDFSCYSWQDLVVLNSRRFYSDWNLPINKGLGQVGFKGRYFDGKNASGAPLVGLITYPFPYRLYYRLQ